MIIVAWIEAAWVWASTLVQGTTVWLLLVPAGIAAWLGKILLELLREWRTAKADQKKAATEFVHIADEYRRYWQTKYYDDENQQPDPEPESSVEWSGDRFDPLLTTEARAIYARLSPALKNQAFALDHKVKEAKGTIGTLSEFDEAQIDYDAPVLVCEIAIAADELYASALKEAGLKRPVDYDAVSQVRSSLVRYRKEKEEADSARRAESATLWEELVSLKNDEER
jgi:Arc/MetJ family transcription regulator